MHNLSLTRNLVTCVGVLLAIAGLLLACASPPAPAPELRGIEGWINSPPLTLEELRGRVVLIDFWTYTCVNCIRTFPYLKEWHARYADHGLVVIGVHTPEFEFEKARENVAAAAGVHGLAYPIAQDNGYATWDAYGNYAWPAKYLVDHQGYVRYYHLGEGSYAETEAKIRELLAEAGADLAHIPPDVSADPRFVDGAFSADPARRLTRELYAGYLRNPSPPSTAFPTLHGTPPAYIMQPEYYQQRDADILYEDPGEYFNHFIYLQGLWRNGPESIEHARDADGFQDYIAINFYATSVNAVLSRGDSCGGTDCPAATAVLITLDGRPLTPAQAGPDVGLDARGRSLVLVDEPRMYRLVELDRLGSHDLRLSVASPHFALFTFTFGAYEQGP